FGSSARGSGPAFWPQSGPAWPPSCSPASTRKGNEHGRNRARRKFSDGSIPALRPNARVQGFGPPTAGRLLLRRALPRRSRCSDANGGFLVRHAVRDGPVDPPPRTTTTVRLRHDGCSRGGG